MPASLDERVAVVEEEESELVIGYLFFPCEDSASLRRSTA